MYCCQKMRVINKRNESLPKHNLCQQFGSCVLKASAIDSTNTLNQSSIDQHLIDTWLTLHQHLSWHSVDTPLTPRSTVGWQSVGSRLTLDWCTSVHQLSADYRSTVNQVLMECRLSFDWVSIKGIDWHSTMDVFSMYMIQQFQVTTL